MATAGKLRGWPTGALGGAVDQPMPYRPGASDPPVPVNDNRRALPTAANDNPRPVRAANRAAQRIIARRGLTRALDIPCTTDTQHGAHDGSTS